MFKTWRARDVAELAEGRRRTNHLRLGRRGRARDEEEEEERPSE